MTIYTIFKRDIHKTSSSILQLNILMWSAVLTDFATFCVLCCSTCIEFICTHQYTRVVSFGCSSSLVRDALILMCRIFKRKIDENEMGNIKLKYWLKHLKTHFNHEMKSMTYICGKEICVQWMSFISNRWWNNCSQKAIHTQPNLHCYV